MSHPSRVRGLKYPLSNKVHVVFFVAPFTGAWIEIFPIQTALMKFKVSHPSRVRGLK